MSAFKKYRCMSCFKLLDQSEMIVWTDTNFGRSEETRTRHIYYHQLGVCQNPECGLVSWPPDDLDLHTGD